MKTKVIYEYSHSLLTGEIIAKPKHKGWIQWSVVSYEDLPKWFIVIAKDSTLIGSLAEHS